MVVMKNKIDLHNIEEISDTCLKLGIKNKNDDINSNIFDVYELYSQIHLIVIRLIP